MRKTEELFLLALEPAELRTLMALRHYEGSNSIADVTMGQLQLLTGYGRTTLSKAVSGLEVAGFISIERTKRNFGKLSKNRYTLLPCSVQRTSTHDYVAIDSNENKDNMVLDYIDNNSHGSNSHNSHVVEGNMSSWSKKGEDLTGDDNIGGFGLLEDDKPVLSKSKLSTDKRDPKTRGRRPQDEWTPADVAAEFSFQLGRKFPLLPGLVNQGNLRQALAKNRKQYGISAVIEMEVMRLFLGDSRNLNDAESRPDLLYRKYLKMFTTHMDTALQNLGMPTRKEIAEAVESEYGPEYLYASDGTEFENNIVGRKFLERYEAKLKGN
jgi:hypothetical protein